MWYIPEAAMCTKKKKAAPEEADVECTVQSMRNFRLRDVKKAGLSLMAMGKHSRLLNWS